LVRPPWLNPPCASAELNCVGNSSEQLPTTAATMSFIDRLADPTKSADSRSARIQGHTFREMLSLGPGASGLAGCKDIVGLHRLKAQQSKLSSLAAVCYFSARPSKLSLL
jgi:hypothetical protein